MLTSDMAPCMTRKQERPCTKIDALKIERTMGDERVALTQSGSWCDESRTSTAVEGHGLGFEQQGNGPFIIEIFHLQTGLSGSVIKNVTVRWLDVYV